MSNDDDAKATRKIVNDYIQVLRDNAASRAKLYLREYDGPPNRHERRKRATLERRGRR